MKFLGDTSSGSVGGKTFSRNRFGQYVRRRAVPVQPRTSFQLDQRALLSTNAAAWRALTDVQRAGWESLGLMISRTDSLGQAYTMNGFMAYCSVNNNNLAAGNSAVSDAPAIVTPQDILTATVTLTTSVFSIAFTATPLSTGQRLFTRVSPQMSAGRQFNGDYRLVDVSAAAKASPADIFSAYEARFGTPVSGNRVFIHLQVYDSGFLSSPFMVTQDVA